MNQRLRVLQDLGAQIERLAAQAPAQTAGGVRRRLLPLAIAVALLGLTAAALAASGVLGTGTAVRVGAGDLTHPRSGFGGVREGGVSGIVANTPDPAGGPPWGLRVITTTRGLACLQVGRVVNGRLGVLGQDGLFHNDGRFHPLPAAVNTPAPCSYPDANGNVFAAIELAPLPASGYPLKYSRKSVAAPGGCAPATLKPPGIPVCPAGDQRALYFGMLGPRATWLSYTAAGQLHTVATGKGGAYLVVLRPPRRAKLPGSYMLITPTPQPGADEPIRQIIYRDASVCHVSSSAAPANPCPAAGYEPLQLPTPSQAQAALHVTHVVHTPARPGVSSIDELRVEFRARVPVNSAETAYVLVLKRPVVGRCIAGGVTATSTSSNINAGDHVTLRLAGQRIGPCPGGTYTGTVYYAVNTGGGPGPQLAPPGHPRPPGAIGAQVPVGHFAFTEH